VAAAGTASPSFVNASILHNKAGTSGGAVLADGDAKASLIDSQLGNNTAVDRGGALAFGGSSLHLERCSVQNNQAEDGGAVFATGEAQLRLLQTRLSSNSASFRGSALSNVGAQVMCSNDTIFEAANSIAAGTLVFNAAGSVNYSLPLPVSTFLPSTFQCKELLYTVNDRCGRRCDISLDADRNTGCTDGEPLQPCAQLCEPEWYNVSTMASMALGPLSSSAWPLPCASGFYGSGTSEAEQTQFTCSGLCPSGHYCPKERTETPVPCPAGTFSPVLGGSSSNVCTVCPRGYWCPEGSDRPKPCAAGVLGNSLGLNHSDCNGPW